MAESCKVCGDPACEEHCVFCGVDCSEALNLPHAADCPFSTGVWSAEPGDCCCECREPVGTTYVALPIGPDGQVVSRDQTRVSLVVCTGCAVAIGAGIQKVSPE